MELVRRVAACGGAGCAGFLIAFCASGVFVEFHLYRASYVVAEFSALVLRETFDGHGASG